MAIYKCIVCGNIYDEEKEKLPLSQLDDCPVCKQPLEKLIKISEGEMTAQETGEQKLEVMQEGNTDEDLSYDSNYVREDSSSRYMSEIHQMAVSGKSIQAAMGTTIPMPNWEEILIL